MKVFITGASGFIGRALAERCRAGRGGGARHGPRRRSGAPASSPGTSREPGAWQDARRGLRRRHPHRRGRVDAPGARRRASGAATCSARATRWRPPSAGGRARFVHFSSVTVFGFDFPDGVDERYPVRPNGVPYVDTKIASEQVVLQAHAEGRIPVTVVRPGDVYGPRSRAWARAARRAHPRAALHAARRRPRDLLAGLRRQPRRRGRARRRARRGGGRAGPHALRRRRHREPRRSSAATPTRRPPAADAADAGGAGAAPGGVRQALRFAPGDNDINPASLRYMLRRGTYSNAKARELLGWQPRSASRTAWTARARG